MTPLEKIQSMKMPFAELKGIEFLEAEPDRVVARMVVRMAQASAPQSERKPPMTPLTALRTGFDRLRANGLIRGFEINGIDLNVNVN